MPDNERPTEDQPSRAEFHPGSTTQGGSDFGQGSSQLGKKSARQGSVGSAGSDYGNEVGWDNEAVRSEDITENTGTIKIEKENDSGK